MFDIGISHLIVLAIVAVLVVGPERLPGYARDAGRTLAALRDFSKTTRRQLEQELGPEFTKALPRLRDPKAMVRGYLADDTPATPARRPLPYPTTRGGAR